MDKTHSIEIFRAGKHVDMHGREFEITAQHVAATAQCYDPAKHESPVVIGHPKTNAPAYGWVRGLRADGDLLLADVQQMEPTFAAAVREGRYKKRSAAFLLPDATNNPSPGNYYLNHVGFLGAQAPAVMGLRDVQFAAGNDVAEFASDRRWAFGDVAAVLRRLRDWMIGREGLEAADQVIPSWQLDSLVGASQPESDGPSFAAPADPVIDPAIAARELAIAQREADQLAREQALTAREAEHLQREQARIAQEQTERRTANAAFASGLVDAGRLLPREAAVVTELLVVLHEQPAVAFASPDGGDPLMQSPAEALSALLAGLPVRVDYSEKSRGELLPPAAAFAAPPGSYVDPARLELLARARAWQAEHPNSSLVEAVNAVSV